MLTYMNMCKNIHTHHTHTATKQLLMWEKTLMATQRKRSFILRLQIQRGKKEDSFLCGCTPDQEPRTKEIAPGQDR